MKELFLAALKVELKRRRINNEDIAERLCTTPGTIGRWFRNGTSIKNIDQICTMFGITIDKITFK